MVQNWNLVSEIRQSVSLAIYWTHAALATENLFNAKQWRTLQSVVEGWITATRVRSRPPSRRDGVIPLHLENSSDTPFRLSIPFAYNYAIRSMPTISWSDISKHNKSIIRHDQYKINKSQYTSLWPNNLFLLLRGGGPCAHA